MKLLNLGCGGQRPGPPWINCDQLLSVLKEGTPERENLLKEKNYVECNLLHEKLPWQDYFDGILLQHVLEHFTCHDASVVLAQCYHAVKPGGIVVASVPDTEYFLKVYGHDTKENAEALFGEPIHDEGYERFFDYALFRHDHKQILSFESLTCLFLKSGFESAYRWNYYPSSLYAVPEEYREIDKIMNRRKFSLEMCGVKSA